MRCSVMYAVVYLNVLLYSLCFRLQAPVEPFLVQKLASPGTDTGVIFSSLQSWASLVYTSGSLAMGLLLDVWGMRCSFAICFASTALSYFLISVATNMPILFLSRVPTFFQHGYLLSQALLLQETSEEERGGALGRLSLAYTFGASISPGIGGLLAKSGDLYIGARVATAGTLFSFCLCFLLPRNTAVDRAAERGVELAEVSLLGNPALGGSSSPKRGNSSPSSAGSFGGLPMPTVTPFAYRLLGIPKLRALLSRQVLLVLILAKIGLSALGSLDGTAEPLISIYKFGLKPHHLGELQSGNAFFGGILAACMLGPLCNRYSPGVLLQRCLTFRLVLALASIVVLTPELRVPFQQAKDLYILFVFLSSINGTIMHGALTVYTTAAVVKDERGTLMGLEHAINSLPTIVTPMLTGALIHVGGFQLAVGASALMTAAMMLAIRRHVVPRYRTKDA